MKECLCKMARRKGSISAKNVCMLPSSVLNANHEIMNELVGWICRIYRSKMRRIGWAMGDATG